MLLFDYHSTPPENDASRALKKNADLFLPSRTSNLRSSNLFLPIVLPSECMHHPQVKPGFIMATSRSMESRTGRSKQRKSAPSAQTSRSGSLVATRCASGRQRALVLTFSSPSRLWRCWRTTRGRRGASESVKDPRPPHPVHAAGRLGAPQGRMGD